MLDIERAINAHMDGLRRERGRYHLTLGAAIRILSEIAPETSATFDIVGTPGKVRSYRGYYSDLAFAPGLEPTTVGGVLADLQAALGRTFEGYKGGDFLMGEDTPLWVSEYGAVDEVAVMDIRVIEGRAVLTTKRVGG